MAGKHKRRRLTGEDYSVLFRRIEESFDPTELDSETIKDYMNASTPGMEALAEQLAQTREISLEIEEVENIEELRELKKLVNKLEVHKGTLLERIEEKIITVGITTTEEFAEEKGIKLTEVVKGNIETWKDGNQYLVIRDRGHFKSWKKILGNLK